MRSSALWPRLLPFLVLPPLLLANTLPQAADPASAVGLGKKIEAGQLAFRDAAGKQVTLADFKGKKAIVVVFLSFECPVSSSYAEPLADLARAFSERGVAFVGVHAPDETAAQIAKLARDFKLPFGVYRDERHAAAEALGAQVTPEAFVLDGDLVMRYRGRIDDHYAARLKPNARISRQDLRQAIEELLAGKAVSEPATRAVGCAISRPRPKQSAVGKVTYHRDVLPILQQHCQECHRPGEVAPFALMTYRQAVNWAADIKEYTQSHKMPPWKPTEGVPMHNERKVSADEIATLARWVDGGTPEGDPATAPAPRQFANGWQLGEPDLVLTMQDDFQLGGSGSDLYRCYVLGTDLPEDRQVAAVEVRPGNRRIVHHAALFVDTAGDGRKLQERLGKKNLGKDDRGIGYSTPMALSFVPGFLPQSTLGGWAPGMKIRRLPDGVGFHLPKGADVVMQIHYHRSGRVEKDRTSVGLYFAKKPGKDGAGRLQGVAVPGHFLVIPAGKECFRVVGSTWVRQDAQVHFLVPHMHLLGREIKMTMVPPDGKPRTLLTIKDWDFNWQETYFLKESLAIKAGTALRRRGRFRQQCPQPAIRTTHRGTCSSAWKRTTRCALVSLA